MIEIPEIQVKYPKYVVLVAQNEDELVVAYVIVNSRINENIFPNEELKRLHIEIKQEDHPFLDHDSYINCSELRTFLINEVVDFLKRYPERVKGSLSESLMRRVLHTLSVARTISKKEKLRFGLI